MTSLGPQAEGEPEASGEAPEREANQEDEEQQQVVPARQRQTENEVSEVEIPNVGRIMVRADADGYNEEVSSSVANTTYMHFFFFFLKLNCDVMFVAQPVQVLQGCFV